MKVLELFAGTRSIGKAFEARGHEVFSVDWDNRFDNIDLYADIGTLTAADIVEKFGHPDVIWASPDCTSYSVAAISRHRRKNPVTKNLDPVSEYAKTCLWLRGLPCLEPDKIVEPNIINDGRSTYSGPAYYATDENGKILSWNDPRTAKERSKTYPGVARAMAEQWGATDAK